jgi:hypothetical protein
MLRKQSIALIIGFLREIGLSVIEDALPGETFLPGVTIRGSSLIFDPIALRHPGDLLHEAGHLAVLPPAAREQAEAILLDKPETEMAAIVWSYAAACYLQLAPEVVFHPDGYRGNSASLLFGFAHGVFPGLPLLEAAGMAVSPRVAAERGLPPYPAMLIWLHP